MEINSFQFKIITETAAELGALSTLIKLGKVKPYLKKNEAFKRYGRANVEKWISDGLITIRKDGDHSASWRIDRLEIELLSKSLIIFKFV